MFFRRDLYKKIKYYDINFIEYVPNTNRYSKHSYYLLKEFLNIININYYSRSVDNIISKNGKGTTAWAVKKNDSISNFEYDIELYFYYANKFPKNSLVQVKTLYCDCSNIELNVSNVHDNYQCLSFNLNSKEKGINYYTTNFNNSEDAMLIDNAIYINKNNHEAYSFFLEENGSIIKKNVYYNFFNNKSLNCALEAIYKICKKKFAHEDFLVANQIFDLPYLNIGLGKICYPITIGEKNDCVGLYFEKLTIEQFIIFLKYHNYDEKFYRYVMDNKKKINHIEYDIGVDFEIINNRLQIKKTAFWGTF